MWGCGQIILHYALFILHYYRFAAVAELADAPDLGSGVNDVGVQVPSAAPKIGKPFGLPIFTFSLIFSLFTKEKLLHSEFYINPDLNPISAQQSHHQHISLLQADNHLSA